MKFGNIKYEYCQKYYSIVFRRFIVKRIKKKGVVSFSSITADAIVKVRHVSDESIARCNKNIVPVLRANAKERTASMSSAMDRVGGSIVF